MSDDLESIMKRLSAPTPVEGGIRTEYTLVVRHPTRRLSWHNAIPWWMTQQEGREVAVALRDFLRGSGFDVELIQKSTVTDVIA